MRGRRRTMAMEGGGGQRLFQGDAELGIAILENLQIVPGLIWRHLTLGVIEIYNLFGVNKLAVDVVNLGASSDAAAKERHGDSLWTCPPRSADHVGRRTRPGAAAGGLKLKHAAPKRPMKVWGPRLDSGGPQQGPVGPNLEP